MGMLCKIENKQFRINKPDGYWCVGSVQVDFVRKQAICVIVGYFDKASKDAGDQPIDEALVVVEPKEFDLFFSKSTSNVAGAYKAARFAKSMQTVGLGNVKVKKTETLADGTTREVEVDATLTPVSRFADAVDV